MKEDMIGKARIGLLLVGDNIDCVSRGSTQTEILFTDEEVSKNDIE